MPQATQLFDVDGPLFKRKLLEEPSVVHFLCDRVKMDSSFELQLSTDFDQSKTDSVVSKAAANDIAILVRDSVPFHGADLRGAKIPGADLSHGQFDSALFQGADLTGVKLLMSWLRHTNMSCEGCTLRGAGIPRGRVFHVCTLCAYSPDGRMIAESLGKGSINIYDASTWTRTHQLKVDDGEVIGATFPPNSQQIVSGDHSEVVRLWVIINGDVVWARKDDIMYVQSVAFSSYGAYIVSAGYESTVRLRSTQTGETLHDLEGHTASVRSVSYSPNGRHVASGSYDGTIRLWDPATGELGIVLESKRVESPCHFPRRIATCFWTFGPQAEDLECGFRRTGEWEYKTVAVRIVQMPSNTVYCC